MIIKYTTTRDSSGNRYCLIVDHEKKTFKKCYNVSNCYDDFITISKTDRRFLSDILKENNYCEAVER